jgi:hypothetical protein
MYVMVLMLTLLMLGQFELTNGALSCITPADNGAQEVDWWFIHTQYDAGIDHAIIPIPIPGHTLHIYLSIYLSIHLCVYYKYVCIIIRLYLM